ncbi:MAG: hypothetical protein IJS32_08785 [Kiritimatiellae bacterium]|nr:hypothetical protein [Kiritimatiellia bacterium]
MKILYIAYSSERIHRRTAYSILSCLHVHGGKLPCPLELVTDEPEFYAAFQNLLSFRPLSSTEISSWIHAAGGYGLAPKTEIFRLQTDSFLFFDGDTVLLRPLPSLIKQLVSTTSLMQKCEYRLGRRSDFSALVADAEFPDFTSCTPMYNSGLFGVHRDNLSVLRQIRDTVRTIFSKYPIRPIDQLVAGTLLAKRTRILTVPGWILHYWQDKGVVDAFVDGLFQRHGLASMVEQVLEGNGDDLFALGFRKNPILYDLYMRLLPRIERFFPNKQ